MEPPLKCYGLIGYPLSHSFSKKYFSEKFLKEGITDCIYENFPIEDIGQFPLLFQNRNDIRGLNVTIPYKEKIIPFLDELDTVASAIGAVNTIRVVRYSDQWHFKGYNTDAYGFEQSLKPYLKKDHHHALILGTGGASKAVAYVLASLGIEIRFVSRNPREHNHISYHEITQSIVRESRIIINTSPTGMYPDISESPEIPYDFIDSEHVLFDLIYNPEITRFMQLGRNKGATVLNGLKMLHFQAEKAWKIWNSNDK